MLNLKEPAWAPVTKSKQKFAKDADSGQTPYMRAKLAYFEQHDPQHQFTKSAKEGWWKHSQERLNVLATMSAAEVKRRRY